MRKHPPSPADVADAQSLDAAVTSMIEVLNGWDHTRPLGSLNRGDLRKLGTAAITGWILERARLAKCRNEEIARDLIFDA